MGWFVVSNRVNKKMSVGYYAKREDAQRLADFYNQRGGAVYTVEADRMQKLKPYTVFLHEDKGDKFQMVFECQAEDEDHAEEQALNAYPNGEIVDIVPIA